MSEGTEDFGENDGEDGEAREEEDGRRPDRRARPLVQDLRLTHDPAPQAAVRCGADLRCVPPQHKSLKRGRRGGGGDSPSGRGT